MPVTVALWYKLLCSTSEEFALCWGELTPLECGGLGSNPCKTGDFVNWSYAE